MTNRARYKLDGEVRVCIQHSEKLRSRSDRPDSPAGSSLADRTRRSLTVVGVRRLVAGLCVVVSGAGLAVAQPADVGLPDVRQAERDLERARWELEEIVGSRLLHLDPPPLPDVPPPRLSAEERSLADRLLDAEPGEWRAGDRARVAELVAREEATLAAAGSRGEAVGSSELASRGLSLLQGSRLLALRDRLAFAEGREMELVAGLEARLDLAARLWLQPGVLGSILGTAIHRQALQDARVLTVRPGTSRAVLERLEALLFRWRLEVPDPAAVLAREGLLMISPERGAVPGGELLPDEAGEAVFSAPLAQDLAELARRCRAQGCRAAAEAIEQGMLQEENPYRVIADLMLPNLLYALKKLAGARELTHLAQAAVALRLDALERGSYAAKLDSVAAGLGLGPDEAAELVYERRPGGGARLRLASDRVVTDAPEPRPGGLRPLLTWDLPPV